MIIDAVIKETPEKIEVFSPKFRHGRSIFILPTTCKGLLIKLVTKKSEIPISDSMHIDNVPVEREYYERITIHQGMWVKSDDTIYIVVNELLL